MAVRNAVIISSGRRTMTMLRSLDTEAVDTLTTARRIWVWQLRAEGIPERDIALFEAVRSQPTRMSIWDYRLVSRCSDPVLLIPY